MSKPKIPALPTSALQEVAEIAAKAGIQAYKHEVENQRSILLNKKFACTKYLLENYRSLILHSDTAIYEASQLIDEDIFDVLDHMMRGDAVYEQFVEGVQRSVARTRLMLEHTKVMLSVYEKHCKHSTKPEDMRRYRTIDRLYIADDECSASAIAEAENVDISTVYKDVKEATRYLTALIFGVDGIKV